MTAHSRIGASSMYRWANCPGSVSRCRDIPRQSSFAAAEGTVAHRIGETRLRGAKNLKAGLVQPCDGHDVEITQEMLDAVELYRQTVKDEMLPGDKLHVEVQLKLEQIHPDLFGTADAVIWCPGRKELTVIDFKYGAGVAVEVQNNSQLKYYALGALLTLGYKAKTVTSMIVQPRCPHPDGPVRKVSFDAIDLLDFAADVADAVKRTEDPNAPLKVGPWCQFCPAAAICPAQKENVQAIARVTFDQVPAVKPPEPSSLTPAGVADILDKLPIFEAWAKAVREHAYQEAEAGRTPPGYKLVDKVARRQWRDDMSPGMLADLADVNVEDLYAEPKLLGIPEIEKLCPGKNAAERAAAIEPFVIKESSGHCLVHESDRRPPVDPQAQAKQLFKPVETENDHE